MTHIREGARVSYVGESPTLAIGDEGRVVAASGHASHVRWISGARTGSIDLVGNDDLVVATRTGTLADVVDDSLSSVALVHIAVRDTYDLEGPLGLLNAFSEDGHLASLSELAEDALESVSSRLRNDPTMAEVLARLDPEEQDAFVTLTANVLLRDVATGGD